MPSDGWNNWERLGGSWENFPVVASNADGRLKVFIVGQDLKLYIKFQWQDQPTVEWNDNWYPISEHPSPVSLASKFYQ